MPKRNRIIYWIATCWLSLGMASTAYVQLFDRQQGADFITRLGYPPYLHTLLGIWKLLGVVVLLAPRLPLLKEWAYAGFFFTLSGAVVSHLSAGDSINEIFPSLLLLSLTILSWIFRPADRTIISSPVQRKQERAAFNHSLQASPSN